jgi:hypothetical protein
MIILLFLLLQHPIRFLEFFNLLCESVQSDVVAQLGCATSNDSIELLDLSHNPIELVSLFIHSLVKMPQLCTITINLLILPATAMF